MKIIKFGVNNFRAISGGLENNQINFNGANTIFIFGQNNVGKSTFLAAYDFFFNDKSLTLDDFYKKDHNAPIEFELELGVDTDDLAYIEENQPRKLQTFRSFLIDNSTIRIKRTITISLEGSKPKANKVDSTYNPATNNFENNAFGSIGLITVFQALMPTPILIKAMPTEQEVEKIVNEILSNKAQAKRVPPSSLKNCIPIRTNFASRGSVAFLFFPAVR
jgi:putative ATP-dependent endonuclease of the OLD family